LNEVLGERALAVRVAERPDSRYVGAQLVVDDDEAARVGRDAGLVEAEVIGVGPPADGGEQAAAFELVRAAAGRKRDAHALSAGAGGHLGALHREVERDALAFEDRLHLARHLGVLARDQPVAVLDNRDAHAEAAVHLRELEADVAATGDDQVLGERVERHHRRVGQHRHVGDDVRLRQHRPAADVEEDLRRGQRRAVHLDRVRPGEARLAPDEREVRGSRDPIRERLDRLADDAVLARRHFLHVDAHRPAEMDAALGRAPHDVRGAGARDERLGRDAGVVDAGASEVLALDQRGAHSRLGEAHGEERAGLAGADHDRVVRGGRRHGVSWRRPGVRRPRILVALARSRITSGSSILSLPRVDETASR
jgi:hypothetical protein